MKEGQENHEIVAYNNKRQDRSSQALELERWGHFRQNYIPSSSTMYLFVSTTPTTDRTFATTAMATTTLFEAILLTLQKSGKILIFYQYRR
jgi:hypothetical protein